MHFLNELLKEDIPNISPLNLSSEKLSDTMLEPEYKAGKSVSTHLVDIAAILKRVKHVKEKNPYLAKRFEQLEGQAKQEVKDQMKTMIIQWEEAIQIFEDTI